MQATLNSDNSVYTQLAADLGPDKVKETARMMGIKSKLNGYCAETLGGLENGVSPLEMANAYATIANGGYRNRPRDHPARSVPATATSELPRALARARASRRSTDGVTYEATKILEQNIAGGTGTHAQIGCPQGGKTGTTDHNIDAWFVGFTPRLSTAVWVGYPRLERDLDERPVLRRRNIDGGTYPAEIWGAYMKQAVGKFCGDVQAAQGAVPVSQPFFGHYSREGRQGRGPGPTPSADPNDRRPTHADDADARHRHARQRRRPATTTAGNDDGTALRSGRVRDASRRPPPDTQAPDGGTQARRRRLSSRPPDWYNLRRQGRPGRRWWYAEAVPDAGRDGYRCREVVQRREGLRLHHPR